MIGWQFLKDENLVHHQLKFALSLMGGTGCFVFIFPHNINDNIHMIGAALFVAAVWALGTLFLIESRKTGTRERTVLLQTILQGTVITYAVCYFTDLPIKNIVQKFAVFGLIIVLKSVTAYGTNSNGVKSLCSIQNINKKSLPKRDFCIVLCQSVLNHCAAYFSFLRFNLAADMHQFLMISAGQGHIPGFLQLLNFALNLFLIDSHDFVVHIHINVESFTDSLQKMVFVQLSVTFDRFIVDLRGDFPHLSDSLVL